MRSAAIVFLLTAACGTIYSQEDSPYSGHVVRPPRMIGGEPLDQPLPSIARIQHLVRDIPVKFCLGSIIDPEWILSSALCLLTTNPESVVVDLGVITNSRTPSPNRYRASNIIIHPDFDSNTGKNDIALVKLSAPIRYTSSIQNVELGEYKERKGTKLTAIGWNDDVEHGLGHGKPEGYKLARLKLNILPIEECKKKFPEINDAVDLDDTQICGYDGEGKDMCGVDYGGPLINEETRELVGIFNDVIFSANGHGHDCHPHHDHPLVFTNIKSFLPWIRKTTNLEKP